MPYVSFYYRNQMLFHFDAAPVLAGRLYSRSLISVRISKGGAFGNIKISKNSLWLTEQIYNQFIASFNWNQGSAFGFLLLVLSSLVVWLGLKLTRQNLKKVVQ